VRGDGYVYQRGARWWAGYYNDGEFCREAARLADAEGVLRPAKNEREAQRFLRGRIKAVLGGHFLGPQEDRLTVDDLLDDLVVHLRTARPRSVQKVEYHLRAVRAVLGHVRATELTTADVEHYQEARLAAGRRPATVNRECERLRQAFRRASMVRPRRVSDVPLIPMLPVENARQGFLSRGEFEALAAHITDDGVRDFLEFFWWTGMRPGEIRQLTWQMFDADSWTLSLDPRAAKTGRGRVIALEGPLRAIVERRLAVRQLECPLIFHRAIKGRPGHPIQNYAPLWRAALAAAKLAPGLRPYDLRRSAIRNLIRAGVHETIVMRISGHRTRSTFDRYNIASVDDLREAVTKVAAYVAAQPTIRKVVAIERAQNAHIDAAARKGSHN